MPLHQHIAAINASNRHSTHSCVTVNSADSVNQVPGDDADVDPDDPELFARRAAEKFNMSKEDVMKCQDVFSRLAVNDAVELTELRKCLESVNATFLSDIEYERLLRKFDVDQNGSLNFEEFLHAFCEMPLHKFKQLESQIDSHIKHSRQAMEEEKMSPADRVRNVGVSTRFVRRFLRKELSESDACLQIPMTLVLFVAFTAAVSLHTRTKELFAVREAIERDITENANFAFVGPVPFQLGRMGHKSIYDVNSFADFWSWINMGLVPLFWPEGWDVNEVRSSVLTNCMSAKEALFSYGYPEELLENVTYPASVLSSDPCPEQDTPARPTWFFGNPVTSAYNNYHVPIGGMRMRQERVEGVACDYERPIWNGVCTSRASYWLEPDIRDAIEMDASETDKPGGKTYYLLSGETQVSVKEQLRTFEDEIWLSPLTSKVELLYATYNPHMDMLTATFILFFVNPSGRIHKMIEPVGLWLHPFHGWWCYVVDSIWAISVLKIVLDESIEIFKHWKQLGLKKGSFEYMKFSNMVDWTGVFYSAILVIYYILYLRLLQSLRAHLSSASREIKGSWSSDSQRIDFFEELQTCVLTHQVYRTMLALYPYVLLSRFFKAFDAQARLALVTRTITSAAVDVMHYVVVFGTVFLIFTVSAVVLFGSELHEFSEYGRAINATFRILLGDFEWDSMNNVGRQQAGVWFWAFMWLLNLVMMNMLIAMIMDVYSEVKGNIGSDTETLYSQSKEMFRRWRAKRAGTRIDLRDVLDVLDPQSLINDDDECDKEGDNQTVDSLTQNVLNLKEEQAMRILFSSLKLWEESTRSSPSLAQSVLELQRLNTKVDHLGGFLDRLILMTEMSTNLLVQTLEMETGEQEPAIEQRESMIEDFIETREEAGNLGKGQLFTRAAQNRVTEALRRDKVDHFDRLESRLTRMEAVLRQLVPNGSSAMNWKPPVQL